MVSAFQGVKLGNLFQQFQIFFADSHDFSKVVPKIRDFSKVARRIPKITQIFHETLAILPLMSLLYLSLTYK